MGLKKNKKAFQFDNFYRYYYIQKYFRLKILNISENFKHFCKSFYTKFMNYPINIPLISYVYGLAGNKLTNF